MPAGFGEQAEGKGSCPYSSDPVGVAGQWVPAPHPSGRYLCLLEQKTEKGDQSPSAGSFSGLAVVVHSPGTGPAQPKQRHGGTWCLFVAHFGGRLVAEGQRWVRGSLWWTCGYGQLGQCPALTGAVAIVLFSTEMGCFDANWL